MVRDAIRTVTATQYDDGAWEVHQVALDSVQFPTWYQYGWDAVRLLSQTTRDAIEATTISAITRRNAKPAE